MPCRVWRDLVADLARRGGGVRESGAFLLGHIHGGRREVVRFELYDDLEPGCLDAGYINFTSVGYRKLWAILKASGLQVVADIHTHPRGPGQSPVDRENPMMPSVGHTAFIVPNYAQGMPSPSHVAMYVFQGGQEWLAYEPGTATRKFYTGFWS
jgi:proteasome lid subunit RPN8/RPN11